MITKTYKSRYPKFSVGLIEGKERTEIKFTVRDVETGGVKFVTTDEHLQKQLEETDSFNVHFVVDSIIIDEEGQAQSPAKEPTKIADMATPEPEVKAETEPSAPQSLEFKTVQEAKNYLNSTHSVPFHQIGNEAKVVEKAKELGLDIHIVRD